MLRSPRPWPALVLVSTLALTGCSLLDPGSAKPETSPKAQWQQKEAPKGPPDRNLNEVVGALLKLDPCKLIDPSAAARARFAAIRQYVRTAPHACVGSREVLLADEVEITLGNSHRYLHRYGDTPVTLAGVKAYRLVHRPGESGSSCEVNIPVSFERSIQVKTKAGYRSGLNVCAAADAFATGAIRRLAEPRKVAVDPATSPLANWSSCMALGVALGQELDKWRLEMDESTRALDGCQAEQEVEGRVKPKLDLEVQNDSDPATSTLGTNKKVGNKTANVQDQGGSCTVRYSHGPSQAPRPYAETIVLLRAPTCEQAEQLTAGVQKAFAAAPPPLPVRSEPLTYRPDEPDSGAPGACVHFNANGDWQGCEPLRDGVQPPSGGDVLAAIGGDTQVLCAAAVEPARKVLGAAFKPVTWGDFCVFVEPTHQLSVWLSASPAFAPDEYGARAGLYRDKRTIDVAGHPAISFTTNPGINQQEYFVYASTGSDISAKGYVGAQFSFSGPRGQSQGAGPKPTGLDRLPALLSEFMATYFN